VSLKWVARKISGGHDLKMIKLRLAVCTGWCVCGSTDRSEHGSGGERWTLLVVQRAHCPPVCRSSGGQAMSEDGRCVSSFERPTHPCFAVQLYLSSTLEFITVLSGGRIRFSICCVICSAHS
jgi:hypothetical protein